jgi:protein CpxP
MTMKNFLVAIGALALTASPAAAHEQGAKDAPKHEHMKDSKMECCKKEQDGKMVCKMMDHTKMDHSQMDHPGKDAAANDDQHKDQKPE